MSALFLPVDNEQQSRLQIQGVTYFRFNLNEERGVMFLNEQELQKALRLLGLKEDREQRVKTGFEDVFKIITQKTNQPTMVEGKKVDHQNGGA